MVAGGGGGLVGPGGQPLVPGGPGDVEQLLTMLVQNTTVIARTLDTQLQVQLRLAIGWTVEQVIADMNLIVAPRPLSRAERREAERRAKSAGNGHVHPPAPADDVIDDAAAEAADVEDAAREVDE